jgi:7-cyano-7-deazaguanine synthase
LKEYDTVTAISFDYGQKHRVELERAQSLVDYINDTKIKFSDNLNDLQGNLEAYTGYAPEIFNDLIKDIVNSVSKITYRAIKLDGLTDLLNSTLVTGGDDVPEGHYAEENQRQTVVPNRNKIFASITQAVALSIANRTGENCDIALGIHAGDFGVYPDCRQEFRDADDQAFRLGNWNAETVGYFTPYLYGDKFTILQDGEKLCSELGLNFNEVYKRTNTSYKPYPSGNSDYKSASSVERVEAFIKLGRKDPVTYEDETGIVSWEKVVNHVQEVLDKSIQL